MARDEALGLAQILLGLLLFTVGILPTVMVQLNIEGPVKRIFHRRIRTIPMLGVGVLALGLVLAIIVIPSESAVFKAAFMRHAIRGLTSATIVIFVLMWYHIYSHVTIRFVVTDITRNITRSLRVHSRISDTDIDDLLNLGESLRGTEKDAVIETIGSICKRVQQRSDYSGTQLGDLLRGLQSVVIRNGTMDHHRKALPVIGKVWQSLVQRGFTADQDAKVLREVAASLGREAVSQRFGSTALRWMSSIPHVVDVPYQIGIVAIQAGQFSAAIEALSRLSWIAEAEGAVPKELIGMYAHFHASGRSASRTVHDFIDRLGLSAAEVRAAAGVAAADFEDGGDYPTADAIGSFLDGYC